MVVARARDALLRLEQGETLGEIVADGTLQGWWLRMALTHCCGQPVLNWDEEPGRTQLERWALVARCLGEAGAQAPRLEELARLRRPMDLDERTQRLSGLVGELGRGADALEQLVGLLKLEQVRS